MTLALFEDAPLDFAVYQAAVFVAVVVLLSAIQWLLDGRRR